MQCEDRYTKGVSGFDIFPRDDYHWCSWKCLFLWMLNHEVTWNGQYITSIERRKDKAVLNLEDCLSVEDLKANVPQEILIKIRDSLK